MTDNRIYRIQAGGFVTEVTIEVNQAISVAEFKHYVEQNKLIANRNILSEVTREEYINGNFYITYKLSMFRKMAMDKVVSQLAPDYRYYSQVDLLTKAVFNKLEDSNDRFIANFNTPEFEQNYNPLEQVIYKEFFDAIDEIISNYVILVFIRSLQQTSGYATALQQLRVW